MPRPAVRALLFCCRPTTVARLIVAIVVLTVQRRTWWAGSHVGEERREVVPPAVTHRDAAPAPVRVARERRDEATGLRHHPRAILAGDRRTRGGSVLVVPPTQHRLSFAPAVGDSPLPQVIAKDGQPQAPLSTTRTAAACIVAGQAVNHRIQSVRLRHADMLIHARSGRQ